MEKAYKIVKGSKEAAFIQLARQIRQGLETGEIVSEGRLPSYRTIAKEFGVSISVVQRAMELLSSESLVRVHHGKPCQAGAGGRLPPVLSKFALIHPYTPGAPFGRSLPALMSEAFEANGRDAMTASRSSGGEAQAEREIAETLLYNGIDGLLLSPENSSRNAKFFLSVSEKIPVVQIDQALEGVELPAVVFDYAGCGDEIGRFLKKAGRQRVFAIVNKTSSRSVKELLEALRRHVDATLFEAPLFQAERLVERGDYTLWEKMATELSKSLEASGADAVFCPFSNAYDRILPYGLGERLRRGVLPAVIRGETPEWRSAAYYESKPVEWEASHSELFSCAAKILLKWSASGRKPKCVREIELRRAPEERSRA